MEYGNLLILFFKQPPRKEIAWSIWPTAHTTTIKTQNAEPRVAIKILSTSSFIILLPQEPTREQSSERCIGCIGTKTGVCICNILYTLGVMDWHGNPNFPF